MNHIPPVAFFIFNRPDLTREVFAAIRAAKPSKLLIVADGPRPDRPGEKAICEEARAAALKVDWDCEVLTDFSESNLGCKNRIATGLDWVFENCEEAILLEDDCLPSPSFFTYCRDLLDRYRDDERIMLIGGTNLFPKAHEIGSSYAFSRYGSIWGWATWRRAWKLNDVRMASWPTFRDYGGLAAVFPDVRERIYWKALFDQMYRGPVNTWDYQWFLARLSNGGLSTVPAVNLITNLGFRSDATHTGSYDPRIADLARGEIGSLTHPPFVLPDATADAILFKEIFVRPSILRRVTRKLKSVARNFSHRATTRGDT